MAAPGEPLPGKVKYATLRWAAKEDIPHIHRMIHQMAVFEGITHLFSATQDSLTKERERERGMAAPGEPLPGKVKYATLRWAAKKDIPHIYRMIYQMAVFGRFTHLFSATQDSLTATLFPLDQSQSSPSVFVLELSDHSPPPPIRDQHEDSEKSFFCSIVRPIDFPEPVADPESHDFCSSDGRAVVVGCVLFFKNYPSFLAKPGFYVEDIFVREAYRRKGLGRLMLSAVAGLAYKTGMGRVEWRVLDWNMNAIKFYEKMGADVLTGWRICRLSGDASYGRHAK